MLKGWERKGKELLVYYYVYIVTFILLLLLSLWFHPSGLTIGQYMMVTSCLRSSGIDKLTVTAISSKNL